VSNDTFFNRWYGGSIEVSKRIAERFGEGEFKPFEDEMWDELRYNAKAATDARTGKIFYNEKAFEGGYKKFLEISAKEKWISFAVKRGVLPDNWYEAEALSWQYVYRNQGLVSPYSDPQYLWRRFVDKAGLCERFKIWERGKWDWIYRIPRRY